MGLFVLREYFLKITDGLIKALKDSKWVEKITDKQIVYTSKFKMESVEQYLRGISASSIFESAGIPIELLPKNYAFHCLKRWTKTYKEQGLEALKNDKRGTTKSASRGRPKTNKEKLTYQELEAIVKIQTEVIEALKKKRALAHRK